MSGVTGVDVEHTKARFCCYCGDYPCVHRKAQDRIAVLVAAVERARAVHSCTPHVSVCMECGFPYPCATIEALEAP